MDEGEDVDEKDMEVIDMKMMDEKLVDEKCHESEFHSQRRQGWGAPPPLNQPSRQQVQEYSKLRKGEAMLNTFLGI